MRSEYAQVSIPTNDTEKSFEFHSQIRMRTIDVELSVDRTMLRAICAGPQPKFRREIS